MVDVLKDTTLDDVKFGLTFLMKHTDPGKEVMESLIREQLGLHFLRSRQLFPQSSLLERDRQVFAACAEYYKNLEPKAKPDYLRCFVPHFTFSELSDLGFPISKRNFRTARKPQPLSVPAIPQHKLPAEEYRDAQAYLLSVSQPSRKYLWLHSFYLLFYSLFLFLFRFW
jgi:hypothetical protein